ncbi:amidase [Paenibacillus protaetiae]|uniref:Amidase n=1 Tax=Paenibacillus protaetiae TaxID=2509456 RepID=A0A4P6EU62_9BACL|nr:amidase [Paenibacillus protaetiae]QAY66454.1 amidase [Paenibacillus protaetiae]
MNDSWNAFFREDIRLEATGSGLLDGKTFGLKDVFAVKGHVSGAGNPDWLRTHEPAERNAAVVDRLLAQGARLRGMTHTDELMYSLNGQNFHYGTPINPKAPDRLPGGSSSGSAVAVAAGLTDFAIGTDTGGSVRVPSAYCGIYGIRPTHGAVTADGLIPLAPRFDTVGWMARNARLLLQVGEALLPDAAAGGGFTRLYWPEEAWAMADEPSAALLKPIAERLAADIAPPEAITVAPEGLDEWMRVFRVLQGLEIGEIHGAWIKRESPVFEPSIAERFDWAAGLKRSESEGEERLCREIRARLRGLLADGGLLVLPTIPGPPPHRDIGGKANEERRSRTMQLSCIAGLSGLPQVTIPAAAADGAPIGLSVIAGAGEDLKLLRWVDGWTSRHSSLLAQS